MRAALARYSHVDRRGLIEGSSPLGVVKLLFEELASQLDRLAAAEAVHDRGVRGDAVSRAVSIVLALEGSLDFDNGGDIARNLAKLYDWLRRTLVGSLSAPNSESLALARRVVGDLGEAWGQLATRP